MNTVDGKPLTKPWMIGVAFLVAGLTLGAIFGTLTNTRNLANTAASTSDTLAAKVRALEETVNDLRAAQERGRQRIKLDVASKSYQPVDTDVGTVIVTVEGVEPEDNGQRITLAIGNPLNADFVGFAMHFAFADGQHKDETSAIRLTRGAWTTVPVVLAPLAVEQLGSIYMSLSVDNVGLLRSK